MTIEFPPQRPTSGRPLKPLPANACDCHAHVFGDPERYPLLPHRSYDPHPANLDQYRAMLDGLGVSRAVLVQPSVYGTDNRCMLDALASFGMSKARGIAVIDPATPLEHLESMHALGVRGVRFNALTAGGAALEGLPRVAERISELGWHIQLWVSPASLELLAPKLIDLPVTVVFDHLAQLSSDIEVAQPQLRLLDSLMRTGRAWLKLSSYRCSLAGSPFNDVKWLTRLAAATWPERCVWGSDWPHPMLQGRMPYDSELIDLLDECVDSETTRKRILVDNPAELYGF